MSEPSIRSVRAQLGLALVSLASFIRTSTAEVLPDDRADFMWHDYDGGGITVSGPSLSARKKLGDSVSVSGNYYVDTISSASIDVVTQASPQCKRACYTEERRQGTLGVEYQRGKSTYSAGVISSDEPDYRSNTGYFSVSQDMFGDLTTVSFGYNQGADRVGERNHADNTTTWVGTAQRHNWHIGLSQILTRNLLLVLNAETSESQGLLQNPYRSVRYADPSKPLGYSWTPEVDPATRTGTAGSMELKYYLPWHASADANYRYYGDTWGVRGNTFRLGYTQPLGPQWTLDGSARLYQQHHASFYSDLFPYFDSQNFVSRDRELAQFHSITLGAGASWAFRPLWPHWISKGTLNLSVEKMRIAYSDFRDVRAMNSAIQAGDEPLYTLNATVWQAFISVWY